MSASQTSASQLKSPPQPEHDSAAPLRATLRDAPIHDAEGLRAAGLIVEDAVAGAARVAERYAIAVTPHLAKMIPASAALRRQFVPDGEELVIAREELADPIGDDAHAPVKGIVHRYADRVLLKPMHACAVYCRFCFRREAVGPGGDALSEAELTAALDYIRAHDQIWEVILSGGDPLLLSARRLRTIVEELSAIDHLGVIRVHTRLPVAAPGRVTDDLVAALKGDKATYVVLHCNHPDELTPEVTAACARLVDAGIPMLAQSVLLRGVNDDTATMERLLRALVAARIKPYYLHHPDLARGTGHFRVPLETGHDILRALRGRLSGLAQPTYVLDIPGGHGKVPVGPGYLAPGARRGEWTVTDPEGHDHAYPPKGT